MGDQLTGGDYTDLSRLWLNARHLSRCKARLRQAVQGGELAVGCGWGVSHEEADEAGRRRLTGRVPAATDFCTIPTLSAWLGGEGAQWCADHGFAA
ncbi:hypothetical protein [Streptomyces sclerotialus]|uniref:hypothetical protein n=1 Tax=Streptomyces sclerotialus TaxID=1957 RepID=UPI0004C9E4CF